MSLVLSCDKFIFSKSVELFEAYKVEMDRDLIDKALKNVFKLVTLANSYIDRQAPWKLKNENLNRMNVVLSILVELIKRIAFMTFPIMPEKSEKILNTISYDIKKLSFDDIFILNSKEIIINKPEPLFPRHEIL